MLAAAAACAVLALLAPHAHVASAQGAPVVTVRAPAPHEVLDPACGIPAADVDVAGAADTRFLVDGAPDAGACTPADPGPHTAAIVDADGAELRSWPLVVAPLSTTRVAGAARDETAAEVARVLGGSGPAVVVNADRVADAFAAAPIASAVDGVILLATATDVLPATETVLATSSRDVIVLGGDAAIGPAVRDRLDALGGDVAVVAGQTRYATAAAAAQELAATAGAVDVVLAPADDWRAALPASALAAGSGSALLLADPGRLPEETAEALRQLDPGAVTVVGAALAGTDVPAAVRDLLPDAEVAVLDLDDPDDPASVGVAVTRALEGDGAVLVSATTPADALSAAPLAARLGGLLLAGEASLQHVATAVPREVVVAGGPAAVPESVDYALRAAAVDGPAAPTSTTEVRVVGAEIEVTVTAGVPLDTGALHVVVGTHEIAGTFDVEGPVLTWRSSGLPATIDRDAPAEVVVTGVVATTEHQHHLRHRAAVVLPFPTTTSPEGWIVAGGDGPVVGSGPVTRFSVEVEPATGLDIAEVAPIVEGILLDPRGWTAPGTRSLQRVGTSGAANIRVVIARPQTVDDRCGRVGLNTGGRLSCWDGRRAMLNLTRWQTGVSPHHTDLVVYRQYLVNHEVGHGLGMRHVGCPAAGALAPVMMQQSKGLGSCVANGWPYP